MTDEERCEVCHTPTRFHEEWGCPVCAKLHDVYCDITERGLREKARKGAKDVAHLIWSLRDA